ncbi:ABC transporter permease, partial [Flavobacterium psychrophilum]|uniref:ABC transporter permease n=2 Tax=Flavobacterium psychrophilum TaxID=96345 RepID=UPI001FD4A8DE
MIENNSQFTPEQNKAFKKIVLEDTNKVKTLLGRDISFRDYIIHLDEIINDKEKLIKLFEGYVEGWKQNGFENTDFNDVYNDVFNPVAEDLKKAESLFSQILEQEIPSQEVNTFVELEENIENMSKSSIDETVEKRSFKTRLFDFVGSVIAVVLYLVLFGFLIYKAFVNLSPQYIFLVLGFISFGIFWSIFSVIASEGLLGVKLKEKRDLFGFYAFLMPFILLAIVPVAVILIKTLIFILTYWFIWLSIASFILLFYILLSKISILKKVVLLV